MTQTQNYQLPKWESTDRVMMSTFNDMTAKLDTALKTNADAIAAIGIVTGTYTGDATYPREINLGFQPKLVLLCTQQGRTEHNGWVYGGIIMRGRVLGLEQYPVAELTANGFRLLRDYANVQNEVYLYAAFR